MNKRNTVTYRSACFLIWAIILVPLVFITGCSEATQEVASVVINEVMSCNSQSLFDKALGTPDWIELHNPSGTALNLSGYSITDNKDKMKFTFGDVSIPADGYLIVYAENKPEGGCEIDCTGFSVSSGGEMLFLANKSNEIVCFVEVPALPPNVSYARRVDGTFGFCTNTTPGSRNADGHILEAGGIEAMLKADRLVLNEVLPKASAGAAWVELYNAGDSDVFLGNYFLTDDRNDPAKYRLPMRALAPEKYLVVSLSGTGEDGEVLHAPFQLGRQETEISLFDIAGNPVCDLKWDGEIPADVSRVAGGYTVFPTMGKENSADVFPTIQTADMGPDDPVRINEVLPRNLYSIMDGEGDRPEWLELHNSGAAAVSLAGYYLSDDGGNLFKWAFPDVSIDAGGYLIVFLSGKQGGKGELHASFRLASGEADIYLTNRNGFKVDSFSLPDSIGGNISVGRDSSGIPCYYALPTPGLPNARSFAKPGLVASFNSDGVYISEVCAANTAKSGLNDWVELHNGSDRAMDLSGYCLSDDGDNPGKWRIKALTIEPNGYAVIEADSDTVPDQQGVAGFGISPTGETLLLSDSRGLVIDVFATGVLSASVTSGRVAGDAGIQRAFFHGPTRGKPNSGPPLSGYAAMPVLSETGLYHAEPFQLHLSCPTPQAKIYYTTNGSTPTEASTPYTGPITVNANTPVRAVACAAGLLPSPVATATFLFGKPHTVPVFCISGEPKDMKTLVETDKRLYRPEFEAFVEFHETDGSLEAMFPSGIRPKGRSSLLNPQNSLVLRLRGAYGANSVTYPFFSGSSVIEYGALSLRGAGQDHAASRIRDPFFQAAVKGMNVDATETRLTVVYINGSYCGVYDLNEEQNEDYFAGHYKLDTGNIDMIDRNGTVLHGDNAEYLRVCEIARTSDMRDDKVFAEFAKLVDTDACIDYLIARIYFGDGDVLNQRFWRARDYSVKWRPVLFDMDWCMRFNNPDRNVFFRYFSPNPVAGNGTVTNMDIFCALRKNKAWRDKFVERFVELSVTQFSTQRILRLFDSAVGTMEPEMEAHIAKWHTPRSMAIWRGETGKLRAALSKRQAMALRQLQRNFQVPQSVLQGYIDKYSKSSLDIG